MVTSNDGVPDKVMIVAPKVKVYAPGFSVRQTGWSSESFDRSVSLITPSSIAEAGFPRRS